MLTQSDSAQIRFLAKNLRVTSNVVPRIMALLRGHVTHEAMGRIYATMGRGMTPETRYTAVMAVVGPLLVPEEGDESMREAFQQMMDWKADE
jgi:hypothetical protein